jgi:hypothetical protein
MQRLKEHGVFIGILLLSTLLRFIPLFDYEFTYDELSGLDRTQFPDLSTLLEKGVKIDAHPALIQVVIFYLIKAFGYINWIVKLPFLVCAQLAVVYGYAVGVRNFSKQSALVTALLLSFSLIFVFYAPIARMYIPGVFFSLALLYYFFELMVRQRHSVKLYFLFGFFALLSAWNHHMNALFAFTVVVSGLLLVKKEQRKALWVTCLLTTLAYLPHLPITLYQLSVPGIGVEAGGWLTAPRWTALLEFAQVLFGTGFCFLLFLVIVVVSLISVRQSASKEIRLLLLLFFINFAIVFFYSIFRSPIFQYSVMLFAGTALILSISALCDLKHPLYNRIILVLVFAVLAGRTYWQKDYLHQAVKTVYEYQFTQTAHYKSQLGEENVFPLFFDCDTLMRNIYFKKHGIDFDLRISSDTIINYANRTYLATKDSIYQDSLVSTVRLFSEFIKALKADVVVLSSAPPIYQLITKDYFPYLIENTQTQAINYKVYSRQPQATVADDEVVYIARPAEPSASDYPSQALPMAIGRDTEFPYKVSTPYDKMIGKEGQFIVSKARLRFYSASDRLLESCVTINATESEKLYSYNGKTAADYSTDKDSVLTLYSDAYIGTNHSDMRQHSTVNAFLWNRGAKTCTLEDFEIRVINYWPAKWQWWD